jgi:hypothetical protein
MTRYASTLVELALPADLGAGKISPVGEARQRLASQAPSAAIAAAASTAVSKPYSSLLADHLPAALAAGVADRADRSVGTAFGAAGRLAGSRQEGLAQALHDAALSAFFYEDQRFVGLHRHPATSYQIDSTDAASVALVSRWSWPESGAR